MDNGKCIVNLEYFKEMMYICPRLPGQTFDELPFEEEILAFLRFLRHSGEIRKLTDVNINKLHQPWRSFADVINKYLSGKSTATIVFGYLRLRFFMTKASVRNTKSSSDTTITPPAGADTRLSTSAKDKQPVKASKEKILTVLSEKSSDEDNDDVVDKRSDDQDDDDDDQDTDDEGDDFIHHRLTIPKEEETKDEESFDPIIQTPKNSDDEGNDDASLGIDSLFELTSQIDVPASTTVASLTLTAPTITPLTIPTISRTLEANFSEFVQTNQFARAVLSNLEIVQRYMNPRMNEPVKVAVQIQSDRLRGEAQAENEEFLKNLDENIQKIIKEQVNEQVKISYVVIADLSKMELKKILIEKMESNKSIHRSDEQRNEKPSVGSDRGSKRCREGKEPESTSAPKEKATKTTGKSTQGSKSQQKNASKSVPAEEPIIIAVIELQIVEWHNYKHLDWITNKDKQNRLMRIDELHKFGDGTLNDVRTALDDHLKGIRMKYLPQAIWRKSDKERATSMI
nr:hypothetical protein [Tanacetum cinerariifolium]